jgi:hypothetical protein
MAAVAGARALLLLVPLLLAVQVGTAAVASDHSQSYAPYFNTLRNPKLLAAATRYQQVMQHKHSLSSGALQRSLVYRGANLRLRKVLDKLMTGGQDVRIGAIGGSITCVSAALPVTTLAGNRMRCSCRSQVAAGYNVSIMLCGSAAI